MADQIPSIVILRSAGHAETKSVEKICWGVEEEGIPFEILTDPERSAVKLAYKAALASRLNVGIGIGADRSIAVHYSQMNEETPVFMGGSYSESRVQVTLGMNAARLVKGLPFKDLR